MSSTISILQKLYLRQSDRLNSDSGEKNLFDFQPEHLPDWCQLWHSVFSPPHLYHPPKLLNALFLECSGMTPWDTFASLRLPEMTKDAFKQDVKREYEKRMSPCRHGFNEQRVLEEYNKLITKAQSENDSEYACWVQRQKDKEKPHNPGGREFKGGKSLLWRMPGSVARFSGNHHDS